MVADAVAVAVDAVVVVAAAAVVSSLTAGRSSRGCWGLWRVASMAFASGVRSIVRCCYLLSLPR